MPIVKQNTLFELCKLNLVDGVSSEDADTTACGSKLAPSQAAASCNAVFFWPMGKIAILIFCKKGLQI